MLKARQISILSLVLLTAGIWAYLLGPTANYVHYYSAIEDLTLQIPRFVVAHTDSNVTVTMLFNVSNPTSYMGLRLASVSYQALIQNKLMGTAGTGPPVPISLEPFSAKTLIGTFVMTGAKMDQYDTLFAQSGGAPQWHVRGTMSIWGRDGFLTPEFDIPVTASST